jgi:hypothetical protein
MSDAAERAFQEFVRGGSVRSQGLSVPMGHDCFEVLCRKNRNPTKPQVKRWYYMLRRPLDDSNVCCSLQLVRRALLDWPKMGAALVLMAAEEFEERVKEQKRGRRCASHLAQKLKKRIIVKDKKRGKKADGAELKSSGTKCPVKMNHVNPNVAMK